MDPRGEGWTLFASRIVELPLLPFITDKTLAARGNPVTAGAQEEQRAIAGRGNVGVSARKVRVTMHEVVLARKFSAYGAQKASKAW